MILIYSTFDAARLRYVLDWIFVSQLQIAYELTQDAMYFTAFEGAKINYSDTNFQQGIFIKATDLLARTDIVAVQPTYHRWKHTAILFYNQPGAKIPFDLFAAVFYCIARYEEYLPASRDKHQRFPAKQSIASVYAFLQEPVVDLWLMYFKQLLTNSFGLELPSARFKFLPTYDIDIAYAYRYKSPLKLILGSLKNLTRLQWKSFFLRYQVRWGGAADPYDNFAKMDALHDALDVQPIYFMLLALQNATFDKNNLPNSAEMKALLVQLAQRYALGIHPSYQSNSDVDILKQEWTMLKAYQPKSTISRQHYIKLHLPDTYRHLLALGITDDYSMGYPDANGFRAGTSNAFPWFDVVANCTTNLTVHPFVYMDATSLFYDKAKHEAAYMEFERLYLAIKKVNGTMVPIFHNYTLGNDAAYKNWVLTYEKMMRLGAS